MFQRALALVGEMSGISVRQASSQLIETAEWQWVDGEKDEVEKKLELRLLENIHNPKERRQRIVYLLSRKYWWAEA